MERIIPPRGHRLRPRRTSKSDRHFRGPRCLAFAVAALVVGLAAPAVSQVEPLGQVPDDITNAAERVRLADEWSRLDTRLKGLQRIGEIFNQECKAVERGTPAWHSCNTQFKQLQSDRHAYNADVKSFRARVADARARARRPVVADLALVEGGTGDALAMANRKTSLLLDALEAGAGDWQKSLGYLEDYRLAHPTDRAAGDAQAYLRGMHKGYLAAQDMSNKYYRYGVRRWLDGDYMTAARAFGQAARDDPDDLKLYRSFAYTVGRQHGGSDCQSSQICVHDSLPRHVSFFGPEHERALRVLTTRARQSPDDVNISGLANMLDGMAVYAGLDVHTAPALPSGAQKLTLQARLRVREGRYYDAARDFAEAYRLADGDRGVLFLRHYFEGLAQARGDARAAPPRVLTNKTYEIMMADSDDWLAAALLGPDVPGARAPADPSPDGNGDRDFAAEASRALVRAITAVGERNPFFGVLAASDVAQLSSGR